MTDISLHLQLLAKRLNLTSPDAEPEPYILTKEEEEISVTNAIASVKNHKRWKYAQMGLNEMQILDRLDKFNWEEEINREDILLRANSSKQHDLWVQAKRNKEKQEEAEKVAELIKRCDARYMYNVIAWASENIYGKKLIIHDDNRHLLKTICFFISNDSRFENELGYSFKKGLLIRGIAGLGKTYLLKCVKDNDLMPIRIKSMLQITDDIRDAGEYHLEVYNNSITYLDDVGTEEHIVNHYGTKICFFKNFIELFYLKSKLYNRLVISTNNTFSEMEEKYGFRVRSRIKDMFNIVDVKGSDMRG